MDELRFLNIIASPSQNVKQPGITDSNSTNLPPIITRFPPGSILAGFVINRDTAGNPILRTESGDITFQSKHFFKIGTELVIRIENRTGQPQAHIISIDGEPTESAERVSVLPQSKDAQFPPTSRPPVDTTNISASTASTARLTPATAVNVQATITATLLTDQPDLPQGTQLLVKVISAEAATTNKAGTPQAPTSTQQPATASNPSYAAYTRAAADTLKPAGNTPSAPAQATPTAPTQPAQPPAALQGQILQATVTRSIPTGETILQTANGVTLQLNTTSPLPPGIKLTFQVEQAKAQATVLQPQNAVVNTQPDPVTTLARHWPALQQILSLLTSNLSAESLYASGIASLFGHGAALQQSGTASTINPQAIPTGLMVFITALRGGDFRGWLGKDNTSWLEDKGHGALVRKAEGEFFALGRQFSEAQPGQWQTLFFPIAVHGEIQQVRFFLKRDRKQKNDNERNTEDDTRFVVELDLSQMGELQLDGFVRKDPKTLEFDLYVRTRFQLDEATRQDIFTIYNEMAELTGFKGQLAFQTVQEFPVRPMEDTHPEHTNDMSA